MAKFNFIEINRASGRPADINDIGANFNKLEELALAETQKGQPGGVASLDNSGKVPTFQLPAIGVTRHPELTGLSYAESGHIGFASETTAQEHAARIQRLEDAIFNEITGNPFLVLFDTLTGLIAEGVWNVPQQRIEF